MSRRLLKPTPAQLARGVAAFRRHESRDAMYRVATYLVETSWGSPRELADGVGVLLLTWNQALYRYGAPDLTRLERFLAENAAILEEWRHRDIASLVPGDDTSIQAAFETLLVVLASRRKDRILARSPVAVAKALHLFAPRFFPLWDKKIAAAYGCSYAADAVGAYRRFSELSRRQVADLRLPLAELAGNKTALKVLDEYNYAKFTKEWI